MPIPESRQHQIDLFRATRRVALLDPDGFAEASCVAMLIGLGVMPQQYDLPADHLDLRQLHGHFAGLRDAIRQAVRACRCRTTTSRGRCHQVPLGRRASV